MEYVSTFALALALASPVWAHGHCRGCRHNNGGGGGKGQLCQLRTVQELFRYRPPDGSAQAGQSTAKATNTTRTVTDSGASAIVREL